MNLVRSIAILSFSLLSTQRALAAANLIRLGNNACSAVVTDENKVLTAKHCVMNLLPQDFQVEANGKYVNVTSISKNPATDLATLTISEPIQAAELVDGYISNADAVLELSTGLVIVSTFEYPIGGKKLFLHTGETTPGSSGSPIFQNGKLVGIHVGAVEIGDKAYGSFIPLDGINEVHQGEIQNENVGLAFAAATAWCNANPVPCTGIFTFVTGISVTGMTLVFDYVTDNLKSEDAALKGALEQCKADRDIIIKELKESGSSSLPSHGGQLDIPPPVVNPTISPGSRPSRPTRVCFSDGGSPWICRYEHAVSSSTANFVTIARHAFVHKFLQAAGRGPTREEAARGGKVMLNGTAPDMNAVYQAAITPPPPPPPVVVKPIKSVLCSIGCKREP